MNKGVNQRLLLQALEETAIMSPLIFDNQEEVETLADFSSPQIPQQTHIVHQKSYFGAAQFCCEVQFRRRFPLLPRLRAAEALAMLARTKELMNFAVKNLRNTFVYFAPPSTRKYRTYFFRIEDVSNEKLSSYEGNALELTLWGLESATSNIIMELCGRIDQRR